MPCALDLMLFDLLRYFQMRMSYLALFDNFLYFLTHMQISFNFSFVKILEKEL